MNDLVYLTIVNLIIWSGIFLYLLHLNKKIKKLEREK
ncbi:MAG: CcmD family protein [Thermoanaerobaculia bacterium]